MSHSETPGFQAIERLGSLADPLRRRLYAYVVGAASPVSREQAAEAVGIGRTLAAYHLDKLATAGLLAISYQRAAGRSGPGAGRPAKLYARANGEVTVTVPPRDYELLARLLVAAIEQDSDGTVGAAVDRVARSAGRDLGRAAGTALLALHRCGYQPHAAEDGAIELRNCPFHSVAQDHPESVCRLNLQLVKGILSGSGDSVSRVRPDARSGCCCVGIAAER